MPSRLPGRTVSRVRTLERKVVVVVDDEMRAVIAAQFEAQLARGGLAGPAGLEPPDAGSVPARGAE